MDAKQRVSMENCTNTNNGRLTHCFMLVVCLFTCVIAVGACIYCTIILNQFRELQTELASQHRDILNRGLEPRGQYPIGDGYTKDDVVLEFTEDEATLSRKARDTKTRRRRKKPKRPKTKAAHYEQVIRPDYFNRSFHSYDDTQVRYNATFGGAIYADGDFQSSDHTLKLFKLAPGYKEKSSPFEPLTGDGKFIAKKTGTYLIYTQVVFYDKLFTQEMAVVHRRGNAMQSSYSCIRGGPVYNPSFTPPLMPVKNTCSVTSLFYLNKKDYITVELPEVNLRLSLSSVNTYFGVVLLS